MMSPRAGEAVDSLGMPIRLHYQMFALSAVVMGGIPLVLSFTPVADPVTHPWLLRLVCVVPFFLAWGYLAAGKHVKWEVDYRIYHAAGFATATLLMAAALTLPRLVSALVALMLIVPVMGAYVAPARKSIVHAATAAVLLVVLAFIATPNLPLLRVVTLEIVMFAGYFMVVTTKAHLATALDRHREQATIDSLTGAANVRSMREILESEIARSARGGDGFSLISFDLDDFKSSNDRYSHATGDAVLRAVAAAAKSELDQKDTLARRGGDEFSIIVPAVPEQSIDELCSRVSIAIARARFGVCPDILPTASIGWADHRAGETADELLARVDDAVHRAKTRSRDQDLSFLGISASADNAPVVAIAQRDADLVEPEDPTATATLFAWRQAAMLFVIVSIVYTVIATTGITPLGLSWLGTAEVVSAVLLAPVAWAMSNRKQVSMPMTHVLAATAIGLIAVIGLIDLDAASQTADLFLVAAYFVMFLVPTRQAAGYAFVAIGLMTATLILGGDDDWFLRTIFALTSAVLVSVILAVSRERTIETTAASARLARLDPLTGLPNVRRLRERISGEIERAAASGRGFSLIMLDLDDFKRVNDRYGHSRGDEVLVAVAGALSANVRQSEMPARRGGDEFAVVLADTDALTGDGAMKRFAKAIETARAELSLDVRSTTSIGYADWQDGDDVDALMKRADAALHDSKVASHRERGIITSEPEESASKTKLRSVSQRALAPSALRRV